MSFFEDLHKCAHTKTQRFIAGLLVALLSFESSAPWAWADAKDGEVDASGLTQAAEEQDASSRSDLPPGLESDDPSIQPQISAGATEDQVDAEWMQISRTATDPSNPVGQRAQAAVAQWAELMALVTDVWRRTANQGDTLLNELSDEKFADAMDKGQIQIEEELPVKFRKTSDGRTIPGLSISGKMTRIQVKIEGKKVSVPVVRVAVALPYTLLDRATQKRSNHIAFVFLPRENLREIANSAHFKKLLANQHVEGGMKDVLRDEALRSLGIKTGRDVVVLTGDPENPAAPKLESFEPKPAWYTLKGMIASARATFEIPDKGSIALGAYSTVAQGVLSLGVNAAKAWATGEPINLLQVYLTLGFAAVIGVLATPYRRWTKRGPIPIQVAKSSKISEIYAYSIKGLEGTPITSLELHDHAGIQNGVLLNNLGKVFFQQISVIRQLAHVDMGYHDRTLPILGHVQIKKADWFQQNLFLSPFVLKYLGLAGPTVPLGFTLPLIGSNISIGIALMALVPLVMPPFLVRYAKQLKERQIAKLQADYNGNAPQELLDAEFKKWDELIADLTKRWIRTQDWLTLPLLPLTGPFAILRALILRNRAASAESRAEFEAELKAVQEEQLRRAKMLPEGFWNLVQGTAGAISHVIDRCGALLEPKKPPSSDGPSWDSQAEAALPRTP